MRFIQVIVGELGAWLSFIIFALPGRLGQVARYSWARIVLHEMGAGARLGRGSKCVGLSQLSIGADVGIDDNGYLDASGGVISISRNTKLNRNVTLNASVGGSIAIGEDCLIGPNVVFRTANHRYETLEAKINEQGHKHGEIDIGDDVWIGANAIILPNVTIGDQSIVAAGAVVTKSFPARSILAGVPAKMIGERK